MNLILLLPKIPISGNQGILIGEILLALYILTLLIKKNEVIFISSEIVILFVFVTYNILISSMVSGLAESVFPVSAMLYYLRTILYFVLIVCAQRFTKDDINFFKYYFLTPFFIGSFASLSIMITRYIIDPPSISEILWGYSTGLRNIPICGYALSLNSFLFLKPIGGGSGNLLCSWSIAVFILTHNLTFNSNIKNLRKIYLGVFVVSLINIITSFSRGGTLTFLITLLYYVLKDFLIKKKGIKFSIKISLISILIVVFIIILMPATVFDRLLNTFEGNSLDPSSYGRLVNYKTLFLNIKPSNLFFGVGFDENISYRLIKMGFSESLYLDILRSAGITGLLFFMVFLILILKNSSHDKFKKSLAEFLILQSIIMWSVTGGDFFSAPVLYFVFLTLGRSLRIHKIKVGDKS